MRLNEKKCFDFILDCFPHFISSWNEHLNYWRESTCTLEFDFLAFAAYTIEKIREGKHEEVQDIFQYIECLLFIGDEEVQNAVKHGFLLVVLEASKEGSISSADLKFGEKSSAFLQLSNPSESCELCTIANIESKLLLWTALRRCLRDKKTPQEDQKAIEKCLMWLEASFNKKRGEISEEESITMLLSQFPQFLPYWENYVCEWSLISITLAFTKIVDFVIVLSKYKSFEFEEFYKMIEKFLTQGNENVRYAVEVGFFEDLLALS